jgi:hypothetical protein
MNLRLIHSILMTHRQTLACGPLLRPLQRKRRSCAALVAYDPASQPFLDQGESPEPLVLQAISQSQVSQLFGSYANEANEPRQLYWSTVSFLLTGDHMSMFSLGYVTMHSLSLCRRPNPSLVAASTMAQTSKGGVLVSSFGRTSAHQRVVVS